MNPSSFFTELKRRNVYKVAAAYVVVGWLIVQVATQTFPFFEVPNWAVRLVILLIIFGFPVALVLAWAFELTPGGIQRAASVRPVPGKAGGRTWIYVTLVGGLLSLGLFFAGRWSAPGQPRGSSEKSLAVLPFENLSEDKSNAYFADGMQDEIITRLAKIGELRVISRSSTERYRSKGTNVAEIARQLGVANLVEGSVQKVGGKVRINVQLIAAANDEHLWAELYDRNLTDIFAVQSEVATAIAKTLQAKLSGREEEAITGKPTDQLPAYDVYLRGLELKSRPGQVPDDMKNAARLFTEATRLDPKFARAWAALSEVNSSLVFNRIDASPAREEEARLAAETARRLEPNSAETLLANAYYRYHVVRDYPGARELFEQLRRDVPSSSEAISALARIARRQSRWTESLRLFEEATELSPRDGNLWLDRAWTFSMLRENAGTQKMIEGALRVLPGDRDVLVNQVAHYHNTGNLAGARAVLDRIPPSGTDDQAAYLRVGQAILERRFAEGIILLEAILSHDDWQPKSEGSGSWMTLGWLRALSGIADGARAAFGKGKELAERRRQEQPRNQFLLVELAFCEAGLGNEDAAVREGEKAVAMMPASEDPVYGPFGEEYLAGVEAQVGEVERAIARIERLLTIPYGAFPLTQAALRLDPMWDPLRAHPRFKALVDGPVPKTIYH